MSKTIGRVRAGVAVVIVLLATAACGGRDISGSAIDTAHALLPPLHYAARTYAVWDITEAVGGPASLTTLNARGQVAGTLAGASAGHSASFIWQRESVTWMEGCQSAFDIDDSGTVACRLASGFGTWDHGVIRSIQELDGVSQFSAELLINNSGTVAGRLNIVTPGCPDPVCVFTADPPSLTWTRAPLLRADRFLDWNSKSHVLVQTYGGTYDARAYVYALDGRTVWSAYVGVGTAVAMNDSDWAVGVVHDHVSNPIATVFLPGETIALGVGAANGINNRGQVVGLFARPDASASSNVDPLRIGAFIWQKNETTLLVRSTVDPRWTVVNAIAINDAGEILALADDSTGGRLGHSVLLRPASP